MASASCSSVASGLPRRRFSAHRHGEQRRVLEGGGHGVAQRGQRQVTDVGAVDQDRALADVVQPGQQRGQYRFPGPGGPHQGDGLPGLHGEVHVPQGPGVAVGEPEPDVDEFQPSAAGRLRRAVRR